MRQREDGTTASASPPLPDRDASPPRQPWRKVLWARQPYDDAHTGESFLEELVVNATVPHRDYGTVVWSALVVDQQLSTVAAVGSASHLLYTGRISTRQLLLADVLLMLLGSLLSLASSAWAAARPAAAGRSTAAAAFSQASSPVSLPPRLRSQPHSSGAIAAAASPAKQLHHNHHNHHHHHHHHQQQQQHHACLHPPHQPSGAAGWWRWAADGAGSMAALAGATALLSPLLGTLTETVSPDSIIACACLLLLAHLYLHDYHFSAGLTAQLSGSLALGCAVCGSVLIASRLGSPEAVYAQLLLSLELYILGPYCRRLVAAASPAAHLALTCAMVATAAMLLAQGQSILLTSSFCCAVAFITFICPMWLVRIHKFKAAINGPWDEAVPRLSQAVQRHLSHQQELQ